MVTTFAQAGGVAWPQHGARRRRDQKFSTRAFWWTCLLLTILALVNFWPERRYGTLSSRTALQARDLSILEKTDEGCRLVHKSTVTDKCRFIRKHCPDEEPGFLAYLDLYYCALGKVKPVAFIILVLWLATLFSTIGIAASDFFCINLSTIATILGMSESLAGVTFLAFGNGSPDVFSTFAAMSTHSSSLAIGELIGAAGFITAVVAGSMALVRPFKVGKKSFIRDVGFFAVAAAFSMGFLADGNLHLWECILMVGYYIFYVVVVVVWHWWITRRAKRRARDSAARGHYSIPGSEEVEVQEEYHDDPDERSRSRPAISRGVSAEDFRNLERGGIPQIEEPDLDEDDEARLMSELATNMQLRRPRGRKSTITPVRPSLVGALEFQAVLGNLRRSRNIHNFPLYQRRHTDDITHNMGNEDEANSVASAPEADTPSNDTNLAVPITPGKLLSPTSGRGRAVSTNDISNLRVDPNFLQKHGRQEPRLAQIQEAESAKLQPFSPVTFDGPQHNRLSPSGVDTPSAKTLSPRTALTPTRHSPDWPSPQGKLGTRIPSQDVLPAVKVPNEQTGSATSISKTGKRPPLAGLRIPSAPRTPQSLTPESPFPTYRDDPSSPSAPSIRLPAASVSIESIPFFDEIEEDAVDTTPPTWWPSLLPTPADLLSTLVPTLYPWHRKSWPQIVIGLVAAPSVFLLTITLPVVDADADEEEDEDQPFDVQASAATVNGDGMSNGQANGPSHTPGSGVHASSPLLAGVGTADVAAKTERNHKHPRRANSSQSIAVSPAPTHPHKVPKPRFWNRWLVIVQLYLAPIMVVLILYTQYFELPSNTSLGRAMTRPMLIGLLVSTILLIPLLLTTRADHRPKGMIPILSLAGFVVSIAWISTIASQVVAVLKALAIILNMSHAILGLTVFAVGNSLGDLVADITVARLGYPVMALSACFGGPMLNILLGIGLSGCWLLIGRARKRVDKGKHWESGTYKIEVGDTLIVSGVTLLLTLLGLLVAVPLNGWVMSKRIAWALIALWCIGTILNIVLEVTGAGSTRRSLV